MPAIARAPAAALVVALIGLILPPAPGATALGAFCDPAVGPSTGARFSPVGGVATNTGSFLYEVADIAGNGKPGSSFVRDYASRDSRTTVMGPGWKHHYDVRLAINADSPDDMLFTLPDHRVEQFRGGWTAERSTGTNIPGRVLTRAPNGTWTVEDEDTTWHFGPYGVLTSMEVAGRGTATFEYEADVLARVIAADGPAIGVEIAPDRQLRSVTNLARPDEVVTYDYDDLGRLASVERPDGTAERYTYHGDSHWIATIEEADGDVLLALEYDDEGRVITEQDADGLVDGQAVRYEYETLPDGSLRTTVTYPQSLVEPGWHPVEEYLHDHRGWLIEDRYRPTSAEEFVVRYSYDDEGRRIVEQDPCHQVGGGGVDARADPLGFLLRMIIGLLRPLLPRAPHPGMTEA